MINRLLLQQIRQTLKNPLVLTSLFLGFAGSGALWYSGIYIYEPGKEWLGATLFIVWVIISSLDAVITLTILLSKQEDLHSNAG